MEFQIIGRSGYDLYPYFLIEKEETIFTVEAKKIEELEEILGGVLLRIEREDCILIPESSLPKLMEMMNQEQRKKFLKWWNKGNKIKINEIEGVLFIVKQSTLF